MRRTGLVVKMTIMTFVFFMLFLVFALVLQGTFFESFYLEQKVTDISDKVKDFASQYSAINWNAQELSDNLTLFNSVNGVELTVLDKYGNIKNDAVYQIIIEDKNKVIHKMHLNHALNENSYNIFSLKVGDEIEAYGYNWANSTIIFKPLRLTRDAVVFDLVDSIEGLDYVSGKIIGMELPSYAEIKSAFYKQPIREIILELIINQGREYPWLNEPGVYEKEQLSQPYNQLIYYYPIGNVFTREMVLAIGSERHIVEAKNILSDYHIYILMLSFVLIIFLSYFYSMTILKPILRLNRAAEKMANLDFSEKIKVERNDEIGSLSESLNTLSTNLSNSMEELKETNIQLKIEIEKERELESLRKDFVSGVSHELKTPLGIIRGYAEGVRDDIFEDKTYYMDVIIEETEKMDNLVVDMLELSKLESTNFKIQPKNFDMYQLIEFVINKFEYQLSEKNIYVEVNRNTEDSIVYADAFRMEQVIVNFMSNAIRYSKKNMPIIIEVTKLENQLLFQIENHGEHIPEDKLSKVWNRFYCVDPSRNKSEGGTGLGLAIVRNIIELHQGQFGVRNTEIGVQFYFMLNYKEG
ncbi:MAG: HAMP domain-containing protein [Clostridia bacterium]|nr:HAMP domain-containing protein [Clostridia bacterium]